jgi:sugar fermentation stimulation protein A
VFRFRQPLREGILVSRPNRFVMIVRTKDRTIRCHCPTTGRLGDGKLGGLPCLYSMAQGRERKTGYTVEAISFDGAMKKRKSWTGINQTASNRYIEHFLTNRQLSRMASGVVRREVRLGSSRIDFLVGNTYVEVKTPLITLPTAETIEKIKHGRFDSFDRLIKHMTELKKSLREGRRAVIAMCYLYDAKSFEVPTEDRFNSRILRAARRAEESGVENWQVNLKINRTGVDIIRYFKNELFSGPSA